MGYGRKIDPEPGRCRRTDGKKWRCSKEAYPDSKYCERHMHRGRNRSRKPVEIITHTSPSKPIIAQTTPSASLFSHSNPTSLSSSMTFVDTPPSYPFLHTHSPSSRPLGFDYSSPQDIERDYRFRYGLKEDTDEHPFFSGNSNSVKDYSDSSTLAHLKPKTSDLGYPLLHLNDSSKQHKNDQYFNIADNDFHREMNMKPERDDTKPNQVMHHFFDELPKNRDSWEDESSNYLGTSSTTQLSISTPNSSYDFFMAHNDK